ncbi:hypothetical protein J6590_103624, partial [Homalodisca vitripennis]
MPLSNQKQEIKSFKQNSAEQREDIPDAGWGRGNDKCFTNIKELCANDERRKSGRGEGRGMKTVFHR